MYIEEGGGDFFLPVSDFSNLKMVGEKKIIVSAASYEAALLIYESQNALSINFKFGAIS